MAIAKRLDYLPALDGLRAIAALLVLWAHFPPLQSVIISGLLLTKNKVHLFPGYIGVDIFFVLSGFLITRILLNNKSTAISLSRFYVRRSLRIFPIYFLALILLGFFTPAVNYFWCYLYLSNYSFLTFDTTPNFVRHTWSLCVEEHFYLLWPLLVQYTPTYCSRKLATYFIPLLAIISSVAAFVYLDSHMAKDVIYRSTNFRMLSLSCGAVLAYNEELIRSSASSLLSGATRAFLLLGFLLLLSSEVFTRFAPLLLFWGGAIFSFGAVLYVIRCQNGKLVSFLTSAPLRYVGSISYGLYLYHYLIYEYLGMNKGVAVPTGTAIFALIFTFGLAAASYKYFERPLVNLCNSPKEREKVYVSAVSVAE